MVCDIANEGHKAEGVYVSLSHVTEAARGAFLGKKAGESFQINVNEAFENETDRAAMLKLDKAQLATLDPLFTFTVVNVKTYVAAEENQETYDKIFGKDAVTTPEQFEEKVTERIKAQHEQEANYRFGADVRKYFVEKAALALPEAFLKRWLVYANEGKFSAEQVEKEFPAFIEDFKWQLVRGYIMQKFNLKVSQADIQAAAESYVAYQYAMYGMANVPSNFIDEAAQKMLTDRQQVERLSEQVAEQKVIAAVKDIISFDKKSISVEKFRELK